MVSNIVEEHLFEGMKNVRSEDETFISRCLRGDWAAFAFLVDKYKEVVHAYAYHRIGDYQEAQDISQEVFIKAYSKLGQLKWPHKFRSWLYTIVSNECKRWLHKHSKEREQEVLWEDVPVEDLEELAVRAHSDEDIRLTVRSAMETLPPANQLAVSLYYMSDLSVREIAEFMGISPNNVKVRLHRARKQLGERLEEMVGKQLRTKKLGSGFVLNMMNSIRNMPIPSLPESRSNRWAPVPISIGMALLISIIGFGISSGRDVVPNTPIFRPEETLYEIHLLPKPDEHIVLDRRDRSGRIPDTQDSGEDITTKGGRGYNTGVAVRKVSVMDHSGAPSPDGRYLSFVEWGTANLAVLDLTTGESRNLTREGNWDEDMQWAEHSIWSWDSKQVAYAWWKKGRYELRVVGLDGAKLRVLCGNLPWVRPHGWSQDGKSILAQFNYADKTNNIVLVSASDGSVRVLKSILFEPVNTSLSPDGRYVVYDRPVAKRKKDQRDIFLLAADGGDEIPLVEHPAYDYGPVWSPDGKNIVFISDRSGSYEAWLTRVMDGKPFGEPVLIKRNMGVMRPMGFTQSGSLYYSLDAGQRDVYVSTLDPVTGKLQTPPRRAIQRFEGFNHSPAWSPDGKYLAYVSSRRNLPGEAIMEVLVIRSTETGEERELQPKWRIPGGEIRHLRWSPDGRYILPVPTRGLNIVDVQTGDVTTIMQERVVGAAWSSDGKAVFHVRVRAEDRYLIVHQLETGEEKELRGKVGKALAISPDGRQLAFFDQGALMVMPVAGGESREILRLKNTEGSFHADHSGIAWTPDGRYILFGKKKPDEPEGLWQISTEGGEPQKLLAMDKLHHISIHPDGRRIAFTGYTGGPMGAEVWTMENFLPESMTIR